MPRNPKPVSDDLHPFERWWRERTGTVVVSDEEILRARTAYWALVTRMDIMIGQILTALRANDLADNTLIVYMSDHGDQVGEHGLWWKHTFYDGSARVPAIISWPEAIPGGQRCTHVVSTMDVLATVVDALGCPALPNTDSASFLEVIQRPNDDVPWKDEAFTESVMDDGWLMRMMRQGRWKLNYFHGHPPQLFDMETDPDELDDRVSDPGLADVRQALLDRVLDGWDPDWVAATMAAKREEAQLLSAWARATQPPPQFPGDHRPGPEAYYLDDPRV